MCVFGDLNEIRSAVGSEIGVSDWIEVTPDRIDPVAGATCDKQWIHVDEDKERPKDCLANLITLHHR
jgi:acyl dehydratase